ncbi:MAG: GGDEF domain-containing protein, partial [Roseitalea porphyridii]
MRVGRTRPIGGVIGAYRTASGGRVAGVQVRPAPGAPSAAGSAAVAPPSDSAEIMGIPTAELTPRVRAAIMSLMSEVDQLRQELARTRAQQAQLERLADQDTLVPVRNRRAFVRDVARALSLARRQDRPISLAFLDLTDFKQVNDMHGHTAGDAALTAVAETLVAHTRAA